MASSNPPRSLVHWDSKLSFRFAKKRDRTDDQDVTKEICGPIKRRGPSVIGLFFMYSLDGHRSPIIYKQNRTILFTCYEKTKIRVFGGTHPAPLTLRSVSLFLGGNRKLQHTTEDAGFNFSAIKDDYVLLTYLMRHGDEASCSLASFWTSASVVCTFKLETTRTPYP